MKVQSVERVLSEFHNSMELYLIYESRANLMSLESLLSSNLQELSDDNKILIAKNIIKALVGISSLGDAYAHGHLSTSNVLVASLDSGGKKLLFYHHN